MKCVHCQTNAGRITKGAHCCELRTLAQGPQYLIAAHSKTLTRRERESLPLLLWIETERLKRLTPPKAHHD